MHRLADETCLKGGKVLEVGFGLGLISNRINTNEKITEHHIIE